MGSLPPFLSGRGRLQVRSYNCSPSEGSEVDEQGEMHCFQRAGNGSGEPLGPPMSVFVPVHALLCLGLAAQSEPPPTHHQLSPMQISSSVSASPMQRNLNSLRESANLRLADDRSVRGEMQTSAWELAQGPTGPPGRVTPKGPPSRAGTRSEALHCPKERALPQHGCLQALMQRMTALQVTDSLQELNPIKLLLETT